MKTSNKLPTEVEISIYRIVQECLTNIHRHSGSPNSPEFDVEQYPTEIEIEVQDDGKGISSEKRTVITSGVGLLGMQERANELGGTLED